MEFLYNYNHCDICGSDVKVFLIEDNQFTDDDIFYSDSCFHTWICSNNECKNSYGEMWYQKDTPVWVVPLEKVKHILRKKKINSLLDR